MELRIDLLGLIIFILLLLVLIFVLMHLGDIWQIMESELHKAKSAAGIAALSYHSAYAII